MERKPKKKKRPLLTILLVILALIVLIPVALYAYLSYDHFHIDDMRAAYDPDAPYSGEAVYLSNGDVEVPLDAGDLYWMMDEYDILNSLDIPSVECTNIAVDIGDDAVTLYATARYLGFLPVPIRAEVAVKTGDTLQLSVESVKIGKWIDVPIEKLAEYGLETDYEIVLGDLLDGTEIRSLSLEEGRIVVVVSFLDDFSRHIKPDMTADTLLLYGAEADDAVVSASDCYHTGKTSERQQIIREYVTATQQPIDALTRLLALCDADTSADAIETLDPLSAHFLLPVSDSDVASRREAYMETIADYNRNLENMLNTLRDQYKDLEIELTRNAYVDTTTGETLSLSTLCPQLGLTDEQCHPVLLIAIEPLKAPSTADLPLYSEIPKSRGLKLDMTLDYMSYDIGVMLMMPNGSTAILYYSSKGEMIVQCLPEADAASIFAQYRVPKLFNLDTAVYGSIRLKNDAPASDLCSYIVFLPWDIEAAWSAKNQ